MTGEAGRFGAYLIAWSQTEIDGRRGASADDIAVGSYWRWHGDAVDVSDAIEVRDFAVWDDPESPEVLHHCLTEAAGNLVRRAMGMDRPRVPARSNAPTFTLTDGIRTWTATPVMVPGAAHPLLAFAPAMPPVKKPLRIISTGMAGGSESVAAADTMVCFTPGTWIDTPGGARQIDFLSAGDKVMTLDAGPQEIVWIGAKRFSVGEMVRSPDACPVRIREGAFGRDKGAGDLVVSPDHRILVRGGSIGGGLQDSEVLVAARDLVNDQQVVREKGTRTVTYLHLLLERHHVISANGIECETFHPGQAALDHLSEIDRTRLFDVMPELMAPDAYGPAARPVLSGAEFGLLSAA